MSEDIENKNAEGAQAPKASTESALQKEIAKLTNDVSTLEKELQKGAKLNEKLAKENANLKAAKASAKAQSTDHSGIPAVLKYKGKKYTQAQILENKDLQKELAKIGYLKTPKKK